MYDEKIRRRFDLELGHTNSVNMKLLVEGMRIARKLQRAYNMCLLKYEWIPNKMSLSTPIQTKVFSFPT